MMLVNVDWDCVLCFMILLVCDCDYSQAKLQKVMRNFKIPLVNFRPKVFGLFVSPNFFTGDTIMLHNDEPMILVQYDYTVYFYLLPFF